MTDSNKESHRCERDEFAMPLTVSYMVGVYLCINAIKDSYLLVEGPDCTYLKTEFIQGNHDLMANLNSVSGFHKIANTALHPSQMALSREDKIATMLSKLAKNEVASSIFLTSMPMAFITGADYDRVCRDVSQSEDKPIINIPGKSLSLDWMSGYSESLKAISKSLDLNRRKTEGPPKIGIVGYLFDRNEEDHFGNMRELKRLLTGIGAEISSVWLDGGNFENLREIETSDLIVSFPYGRFAAKKVAKKLDVPLLELEYPFGLQATERMLRSIGSCLNLEKQTEALVDRELKRIVPKLEWAIPSVFLHKKYGYVGDPVLVFGFKEIVELLGGKLEFAYITSIESNAKDMDRLGLPSGAIHINPTRLMFPKTTDLIVSNSDPYFGSQTPVMEFGFPSYFSHYLFDRPFLGMNGFLAFADSLLNNLRRGEFDMIKKKNI